MNKENHELIKKQIFGIIKSILLSYVFYIPATIIMSMIFYQDVEMGERDFTPLYLCMIFIYAIAFYLTYIRKSTSEKQISDAETFNWKFDLVNYIKDEGKYLMIIFGILAVILEVSYFILPRDTVNPILIVIGFCFSLTKVIEIPILRTVLAYLVTMTLILLLTTYRHYKEYNYWSKPQTK